MDLKELLERNKIYFEIFSSFCLGVMAILVSFCSLYISNKQTKNEELLNMPLIKVTSNIFTQKENINSQIIVIENVGGIGKKYDIKQYNFLTIKYFPLNEKAQIRTMPINDLFNKISVANDYKGLIAQLYSKSDIYKFDDILSDIRYLYNEYGNKDNPIPHFEILIETYISINYYDFKNDVHTDFFKINRSNVSSIEDNNEIFSLLSNKKDKLSIDKINTNTIFKIVGIKKPSF